ncbi:hypothetical protein DyAD56_16010 [Dyella sp. AD56]|uniref:hypothetical protein n=1 Tax=Dyella sp. AD56 TaxID=1528744 RepID=UPI000CCB0731|nr:hypothetical protein [Dyella sp. AD56]PMQ04193.1 hypothetical protein DyAD56_16010 [Dyella sp. AD56]
MSIVRLRTNVNAFAQSTAQTQCPNMEGMSYLQQNLKWLFETKKTNGYQVAQKTGVVASTINRIVNSKFNDARDSTIRPIAEHFGLSVNDLKNVDLQAQEKLLAVGEAVGKLSVDACLITAVPEFFPEDAPLMNLLAPQDTIALSKPALAAITTAPPSDVRFAIALDDAMRGEIEKGELVLIDTRVRTVTVDGIYAFTYFKRPHIKRGGHEGASGGLMFTGTNPRVNNIPVETEEEMKGLNIIGQVIASFTRRRY